MIADHPAVIPVNVNAIPLSLQAIPHWLAWRWELRNDEWTKPPYQPGGSFAKVSAPDTWSPFASVLPTVESGKHDGIGFVLTRESGVAFIDLDRCRDAETGEIDDWGQMVIDLFRGAYMEVSPSGTGVKILGYGRLPEGAKHTLSIPDAKPKAKIELYDSSKYTTVTGIKLDGSGPDLIDIQPQLNELYEYMFPPVAPVKETTKQTPPVHRDGNDVIALARKAGNGAAFSRLYDHGDLSDHGGDQSAADLALANYLAFWFRDPSAIDQWFRKSALMRSKWDERHSGDGRTYGQMTIDRALKGRTEFFGDRSSMNGRGHVTFTRSKTEKDTVRFAPTDLPESAIVGWFREYVDLVEPTTEAPDAFHLAAAITMIGSCIGKRVGLFHASDRLYANFYTLLIGPSGSSRKDTSIRRMIEMFYAPPPKGDALIATGIPFRIARDISSSEGLIAMLRKHPNVLLYTSEFSKVMSNASREATISIGPTLIEAFDTPPSLQNNTKANVEASEPMEAKNPFVSVISTVQPEILAGIIASKHVYSGLFNRWTLVPSHGKGPRPNPPDMNLDQAYRLMRRMMALINGYAEGTMLRFDDEALELWADWYVRSFPRGNESAQEDAMSIRRGTMIKKLALVHAVADGASAVSAHHLETGIAFSDWSWANTKRMLPMWGESKEAELERTVIEQLTRFGPMKKREIQRKVASHEGPGMFARALKAMVENDTIAVSSDGMVGLVAED